jgi:hypothetical protein
MNPAAMNLSSIRHQVGEDPQFAFLKCELQWILFFTNCDAMLQFHCQSYRAIWNCYWFGFLKKCQNKLFQFSILRIIRQTIKTFNLVFINNVWFTFYSSFNHFNLGFWLGTGFKYIDSNSDIIVFIAPPPKGSESEASNDNSSIVGSFTISFVSRGERNTAWNQSQIKTLKALTNRKSFLPTWFAGRSPWAERKTLVVSDIRKMPICHGENSRSLFCMVRMYLMLKSLERFWYMIRISDYWFTY